MRRRLPVITAALAFLLCNNPELQGKSPLVDFNVEWGYGATLYENRNFVYYDDYGSRIPDKYSGASYVGNAFVLAGIGLNIGEKSNVSLQSGYMGLPGDRKAIPLRLRYKYAVNGPTADGAILIAGGGIGFPVNTDFRKPLANGIIGGGYRLVLSRRSSLDIQCTAAVTYDRPGILQKGSGFPVRESRILHNDAFYASLNIGLAINF